MAVLSMNSLTKKGLRLKSVASSVCQTSNVSENHYLDEKRIETVPGNILRRCNDYSKVRITSLEKKG